MTSYVANALLSLVSVTLVVRHLGVAEFGRYATALSVISITVAILEGGLMWMAVREYTIRRGDSRTELMQDLLGLRIVLTAVAAALAIAFAFVAGYDTQLFLGALLATIGTAALALQPMMSVALQAQLRWGTVSLIDLAAQATRVACLVVLVAAGAGLVPLLAAGIPSAAVGIALTASVSRGTRLAPRFRFARWGALIREQLPFAATIAVGSVYPRLTLVVLQLTASPLQTGYFATSFRVMESLVVIPVMLVGAVFPIMTRSAHDDRERNKFVVGRALEVAFIGGTLLTLGTVLGASFIIDVIVGARGEGSVSVLQIQSLVLIGAFLAQAAGFGLLSIRRYRTLLRSSTVALVTSVVLTVVLGSTSLGARGAGIAAVATEVVLAAQLIVAARRCYGGLGVSRRVLVGVPVAAAIALLTLLLPIPAVTRVVIALPAYLGVLRFMGAIPQQVLDSITPASGIRRGPPAPTGTAP